MYISPHRAPLAIVADTRLKSDADLDAHEGGEHVLDLHTAGRAALNPSTYISCQRIALFEYKAAELSDPDMRGNARAALRAYLMRKCAPTVTIVIPTADLSEDGDAQKADTISWGAFGAPDSMANMRGCFFEWAPGRYVCPVYASSSLLKELQKWEMGHWYARGMRLAESVTRQRPGRCGPVPVALAPNILMPARLVSELANKGPQSAMLGALESLAKSGRGLAVDIESIEDTGTMTAIGISDGSTAVSVGWDTYIPHGSTKPEAGILADVPMIGEVSERVQELLASRVPKVFHNHTFDVPRLAAKGLQVKGKIEDTFAASAIAYPELRHGLQAACATAIPMAIPPWKSLWHPKLKGINRDDIEYWTCDPVALRDYNARDAFYTWHLAAALLPKVGRFWPVGGLGGILKGTADCLRHTPAGRGMGDT